MEKRIQNVSKRENHRFTPLESPTLSNGVYLPRKFLFCKKMLIGGLQKTTLIDYSDKIAATVFLSGCNFRCPWCYASHLVLSEKIKEQPAIPEKDFFKFLKSRKGLLEAVVICGGEPTVHKDLSKFVKKIKDLGFLVKLDTNGSNPAMLTELIKRRLINYVAMDIKGPKEKYGQFVGNKVDIKKIQKSIDILKKGEIDYEFRSTIVPSLHTKEDIIEMAKWIRGAKRYCLQNFRLEKTIDPEFGKLKPNPEEYLLEIQKQISLFFQICQIR